MKLAEMAAGREGAIALVTGESLGQVASQTLEYLCYKQWHKYACIPPSHGMDKVDIMDISRKIGTYDISILPYEDCCTILYPSIQRQDRSSRILRNRSKSWKRKI